MCWLQVLASIKEQKEGYVMRWLQVLASTKERKLSNVLIASYNVNEGKKVM